MRTHPSRPNLILALACSLTIALFVLVLTVRQAHLWGSFLLPVVLVFLWGRRRDIYIVTALASVLVLVEYWTNGTTTFADLLVNHLAPILILWAVALLLTQRRQWQEQLARCEQELDAQVSARTAALSASEKQLAKIFDANPGGIAITRQSDGCCVEANDAYLALVGYSREQLIGHSLVELGIMAEAARKQVRATFEQQGSIRGLDLQITNARGECIDILYSLEQVDFNGESCYLGLIVDITERKRLEVWADRLAAIVEAAQDAVASVDLDGTILTLNRSAEALYGTPAAVAVGQNLAVLTPPDYAQPIQEMLSSVARGNAVALDNVAWQRPDGSTRVLSVSISPIHDSSGRVTAFTSIARDITERKRLEDALAAGKEQLRAVIENTEDSVWSVDHSYRLLVANSVFARGAQQYLGRPVVRGESVVAEPFPAGARAFWQPLYDRALAGESFTVEVPSGPHPGRTMACHLHPMYAADGTITGVSGRAADITELKRVQQLLQGTNAELEARVAARTAELQSTLAELQRAGRLKDEFLAMISHELRTPLTGVLSMAELLTEQLAGPLNDRQSFYVNGIVKSGERLLNIVNGILSYTHLLSGKVRLDAEPCELAYLLELCAASSRRKAGGRQQTIAVVVEPPHLAITSDATALVEVIKRLLDNAVKFTPDGGQIGLEAHPGAAPATVDLVVWDTGIGIAADQHEHIFHAFTQVDGKLARSHEGLGLGLAYVDQMVRLLGGTLALKSELGAGSRFAITLPAAG